jgi:hypothetical protein
MVGKKWKLSNMLLEIRRKTERREVMEQVEKQQEGTSGESRWWNRWRNNKMEEVDRAGDGTGGEITRWNKWGEQVVEQMEKQQDGTSG